MKGKQIVLCQSNGPGGFDVVLIQKELYGRDARGEKALANALPHPWCSRLQLHLDLYDFTGTFKDLLNEWKLCSLPLACL